MASSILLTGFEPFGSSPVNSSAEAIGHFAAHPLPHIELHTRILPVDMLRAPEQLLHALMSLKPDWCVMLGQAEGRATISIERVAVNLCDFRIPDNGGHQIIDEPIAPDGPAAYFTGLPARELTESARAVGVPTELSLSAGTYLCNLVFYTALHACATHELPTRSGFVHMPLLPAQAFSSGRNTRPTMALETTCAGLQAILTTLVTAR